MKKRHIPISENMFNGELVQAKCYCGKVTNDKTELVWKGGIEITFFREYENQNDPEAIVKANKVCGNCYRAKFKISYNHGVDNWNHVIKKNTPIKYISKVLQISNNTAQLIKMIITAEPGELGFLYRILNKTRRDYGEGIGVNATIKMDALNQIYKGFGVESLVVSGKWIDSYWRDNCGLYVNVGETYQMTIVYDTEKQEFICTSWGDFYETLENEKEIEDFQILHS
jgi:hypothetical protein